ncbi:DUF6691 family protein [Flavobacterium lacus]|jgi:uncharacterized protein|uniref:Uncharacterized protein n=1 Tax=Flavobacterium lacus TaxID=1353778 RepID=A0A328WRD9_9FLAO|nr:DUF6691 family protein [Flavobacterium lacus]RAR48910.1 hypothetical protein B0I10_10446 [Flavobacterium lacus]
MNLVKYLVVGILFGIVLTKTEAVSWYRIYEMFHFQSFHMYGIIGTAIATGLVGIQVIKRKKLNDIDGMPIEILDKEKGNARYWIGGILFGLGWALVGACPGPIFILLGAGFYNVTFVLLGAVLGTFLYGLIKDRLPH